MQTKRKLASWMIVVATVVVLATVSKTKPVPSVEDLIARGNLLWYNSPAAFHVEEQTFIGWMTSKREIVVAKFSDGKSDHSVVDMHPYLDDHGPPILHIADSGPSKDKVQVYYCLHNSPIYSRHSESAFDVDGWEDRQVVATGECTYPTLTKCDSRLLLSYRRTLQSCRPYCMKLSKDGGSSFEAEIELIRPDTNQWVYAFPKGTGNIVDCFFGVTLKEVVKNIYHVRSPDGGLTWTDPHGNHLELPIDPVVLDPHFQTEPSRETRIWDVAQTQDRTVAIFVDYNTTSSNVYWAEFTLGESNWSAELIGSQGLEYYPAGACIMTVDPPTLCMSVPDKVGKHRLVMKERVHGVWKSVPNAEISHEEHSLVRPVSVRNKTAVFWVGVRSYPTYQKFDTFIDGTLFGASEKERK